MTTCDLFFKYDFHNACMGPRSQQFSAFCRSVSCETVSNAFLKSMKVAFVTLGFDSLSFQMSREDQII